MEKYEKKDIVWFPQQQSLSLTKESDSGEMMILERVSAIEYQVAEILKEVKYLKSKAEDS